MRKQAKFIGIRAREDGPYLRITKGKLYAVDTSWAFHDQLPSGALGRTNGPWAGGPFIDDAGHESCAHVVPGAKNADNVSMVFEVHV